MPDNSVKVRITSITLGNTGAPGMPAISPPGVSAPTAEESYVVSLQPVETLAGQTPISLVRTSLTGLTVGKIYDLTLTPSTDKE